MSLDRELLEVDALWFPVAFVQDLDPGRPVALTIYDRPVVLFRSPSGSWSALPDRCAHRCARLSDGSVREGKIECSYHGWQFDAEGTCAHIPQLETGRETPNGAHLRPFVVEERQGMLWVWLGDPDAAGPANIPTIDALDQPDMVSNDFVMDLPYSQSYLVENVLDVAHIHIAHDGMAAGGSREHALPLEFEIEPPTIEGIRARFRTLGLQAEGTHDLQMARVELRGPNLVWYESVYAEDGLTSGLGLYALPLGANRCRLLYRSYSNFWTSKQLKLPRWKKHQHLLHLLEQDMNVVMGQSAHIDGSGKSLKQLWLPIKSSDSLVVTYRKWLDEFGASLPGHRGFAEGAGDGAQVQAATLDEQRLRQHTKHCSSCSSALRKAERARAASVPATVALLALGVAVGGTLPGFILAGLACLTGAMARTSQTRMQQLTQPASELFS